jgi:hypothetical protein
MKIIKCAAAAVGIIVVATTSHAACLARNPLNILRIR